MHISHIYIYIYIVKFMKTSVIQIPRCYKSGRIVRRLLQCYDVEDSSKKMEFSTAHFSTFVFLNP